MSSIAWPTVSMADILTVAGEPQKVDPTLTYPNIGIYSFGKGVFEKPPILGGSSSALVLYRIRGGQFIYSRLFAFEGAYSVVPPAYDGYFVSNEFPTFDCDADRVSPAYLRWLFRQPDVWKQLAATGVGMGDRRKRVHPERVLEYRAPLPALDAQSRITARLDAAESGIIRRQQLLKAVYTEAGNLLASAFERLVEGAPQVPLGDVAPLVRRAILVQPDAMYTEIGIRSFFRGTFHRRTLSGAEFTWQKLFRVAKGDLVFSNLMAWEQGIAVAGPTDDGCVGNHRMLTCEADPSRILPAFLWFYFTTPPGFAQVLAASPGSIARNKTLSAEDLPNITVPVPSLDAQAWFVSLHRKVEAVRKMQAEATSELAQLTPALLEAAFGSSGDYEQVAA